MWCNMSQLSMQNNEVNFVELGNTMARASGSESSSAFATDEMALRGCGSVMSIIEDSNRANKPDTKTAKDGEEQDEDDKNAGEEQAEDEEQDTRGRGEGEFWDRDLVVAKAKRSHVLHVKSTKEACEKVLGELETELKGSESLPAEQRQFLQDEIDIAKTRYVAGLKAVLNKEGCITVAEYIASFDYKMGVSSSRQDSGAGAPTAPFKNYLHLKPLSHMEFLIAGFGACVAKYELDQTMKEFEAAQTTISALVRAATGSCAGLVKAKDQWVQFGKRESSKRAEARAET